MLKRIHSSSPVYALVMDFNDKDLEYKMDMVDHDPTSVEWTFLHMKRLMLTDTCKAELKRFKSTRTVGSDYCARCRVLFHYDMARSDKVCAQCGIAIQFIPDEAIGHSSRDRYNRPARHHYTTAEHFSQVVCDFTCTGNRTVPVDVMSYCRTALGNGPHVTSERVFYALRSNGYRAYYHYKYEIAARLRGRPEFDISSAEVRQLRHAYKRYGKEFLEFQRVHGIGKVSSRGKLRVFWPMRYILARMCEEIGRSDLKQFIRGIAGPKRLVEYDKYWAKLKVWVDRTAPVFNNTDVSMQVLKPLAPSRHRHR